MRVSGVIIALACCPLVWAPAAGAQTARAETHGPPTALEVTVVASHGGSYADPGHSDIVVSTTRYAQVSIRVTFASYFSPSSVHFKERLESEESDWGPGESDGVAYEWSCNAPEDTASYEVQARGESGGVVEASPALVRKGTFVEAVSKKWCAAHRHAASGAGKRKSTGSGKHSSAGGGKAGGGKRSNKGAGKGTNTGAVGKSNLLSCAAIQVTGTSLRVQLRNGGATCAQARRTLQAFLLGGGAEHDGAWSLPGGWTCRYEASGGRCVRHLTVATATLE